MHNPFLLNNLTSQGFRYILFASAEEKKMYSENESNLTGKDVKSTPSANNQNTAIHTEIGTKTNYPATNSQGPHFSVTGKQSVITQTTSLPQTASTGKNTFFPKKQSSAAAIKDSMNRPAEKNPLPEPILPVSQWPAFWKQIQKRCQLPEQRPQNLSNQIVWTYLGLETDLFTHSPSDKRRQLIAQIIKTLSFPKGTHIFLPYRHISEEGATIVTKLSIDNTKYSFFWSAIDLIRPRTLVIFGEKCAEELKLPPLLPTQKHTLMPVTIYALDDIMLYTENETENNIMINFLKMNLKAPA